jgi:hypothetical protein
MAKIIVKKTKATKKNRGTLTAEIKWEKKV